MSARSLMVAVVVAALAVPVAAAPLSVTLRLDDLSCAVPTERKGANNRDEVYVEVIAVKRGAAPIKRRLPRSRFDDYYEFWAGTSGAATGFTNRDQIPQGVPQLWEGILADGESVLVVVRINEQDNKQLPLIKALLLQGLDLAAEEAVRAIHRPGSTFAVPGEDIASLFEQLRGLFTALPKKAKDDFIGAFAVTIANDGGAAPHITWGPMGQLTASVATNRFGAAWDADGTGGAKYHLAASVDAHANLPAPTPPLRYVGVETDRCDADAIEVAASGGDAHLRKGDSALIEPRFTPERHFLWRCGDSDERSRCRDRAATTIRALRAKQGRRVRWGCFAP